MNATEKKIKVTPSVLEQQLLCEPVPVGSARLYHRVWLHAMYVDAHMTAETISSKLGVEPFAVVQALKWAGIKLRPKGGKGRQFPQLSDPVFMVEHLASRGMSLAGLSRLVGCGDNTVHLAIERQEIKDALAAAGWSRKSRPAPVRRGRVSRYVLPDNEELMGLLTELAGESSWVSNKQLVEAAGLEKENESTIRGRMERLTRTDRVVVRSEGNRLLFRPKVL